MKDVSKAIEAVWKIESTRLIAAIARVTHDIGIDPGFRVIDAAIRAAKG